MFQNACVTEADIRWVKRRENCQNLSAPILTSHFAVVYIKYFFSFLRAPFEFGIPRLIMEVSHDLMALTLQR